ncbi:hypothetical protein HDE_03664 [Halotydeus destructor]|nr:hypothetical protein HDE_03664 [Halotydeus destructor]
MNVFLLTAYLATILGSESADDASLRGYERWLPKFPDIDHVPSFHTKATVKLNGRPSSTMDYEEFHDVANKQGRVDASTADWGTIGLYDDETMQYVKFRRSGDNSQCKVENITGNGDNSMFWSEIDLDPKNGIALMIGPSSVWRKATRIPGATGTDTFYKGTETVRGIACDKWEVPFNGNDLNVTVVLFFPSNSWQRFGIVGARFPVRFFVQGTVKQTSIDYEVDYFLFEPYPETWREFTLYVDYENQVIRHDQHGGVRGMTSRIEDMRSGITFISVPGRSCAISHTAKDFIVGDADGIQRMKVIRELLALNGDYYYLGTGLIRGFMCDIWERVVTDYYERDNWKLSASPFSRITITHFFAKTDALKNEKQFLVKSLITGYNLRYVGPKSENFFHKTYQREINLLNFRPLNFGPRYDDIFNVQQCFFDPADRLYVDMLIRTEPDSTQVLGEYLKQVIVSTMQTKLAISPLRVGQVDIASSETGLLVRLLLLGKPPAIAAFGEWKGADRTPLEDEPGPFPAVDVEACADLAVNSKYGFSGFKFSSGNCYVMNRHFYKHGAKPSSRDLNYKMYLRNEYGESSNKAWKELSLSAIEIRLKSWVLKKQLSFKLGGDILGNNTTEENYIVDNIQVAPNVLKSQADSEFYESFAGKKLIPTNDSLVKAEVQTLGACYSQCFEDESMDCQSFSFCQTTSGVHCITSTDPLTSDSPKEDQELSIVPDPQCSVYSMPYVNRFNKLGAKTVRAPGGVFVKSKLVHNVNDCAQQCTKSTDSICESFQYCSGKCFLHQEHHLDFANISSVLNEQCDFYSKKYLYGFTPMGNELIVEETPLDRFAEISVDTCAQSCSRRDDCSSINYCPENAKAGSLCELNSKSVLDSVEKVESRPLCRHYVKKYTYDKLIRPKKAIETKTKEKISTSGFTGGGFFGFVLMMFLIGIGLGVGSVIGNNYYHNRASARTGSGRDISVKFIKQKDEVDQS